MLEVLYYISLAERQTYSQYKSEYKSELLVLHLFYLLFEILKVLKIIRLVSNKKINYNRRII